MEPDLPSGGPVDAATDGPAADGPAAVAETHISVVLFNGPTAYKWCKPVNLGFIDLSTPARREAALLRELELNRRFAPDVYLDVLRLVPHGDREPVDHVLVMRRMP